MKIGDTIHFVTGKDDTTCGQVVSFDDEKACIMVTYTTWDEGDVANDHQVFEFVEISKIHQTWEDAIFASRA
jgi:ribosomal protein L24